MIHYRGGAIDCELGTCSVGAWGLEFGSCDGD